MGRFGYYGFRLLVYLFGILPLWMVYKLSDFLFFFFYKIIHYRRRVVNENLRRSFPEKSSAEIDAIARQFYQQLCDNLLESLKGLTMSKARFQERYRFGGTALLDAEFEKNQSIIIAGGHFNNWEWGVFSVSLWLKHKVIGIYKPINNKYIDKFYNQQRTRFGLHIASMKQAGRAVVQHRHEACAFVFIADQAPSDVNNCHWIPFLHQETAFLQGVDKIARSTNYPVFYFDIKSVKRGYYELTFSELVRNPANLNEGEITALFAQRLEQSILERPADWLWSHKRWKRGRVGVME